MAKEEEQQKSRPHTPADYKAHKVWIRRLRDRRSVIAALAAQEVEQDDK